MKTDFGIESDDSRYFYPICQDIDENGRTSLTGGISGSMLKELDTKYVIIGLLVVIGTFIIMNYWPKLKEQTKNRILLIIFAIFFIRFF